MNINHKWVISLFCAAVLAGCSSDNDDNPLPPTPVSEIVNIRVVGLNDFHGALRAPNDGKLGGIAHMATLISQLKDEQENNVVVGAGDLIGATPFLSSMFHDEPTIEALSMIGLEATSVGNHEFDKGQTELLRKQNGGCLTENSCMGPNGDFKGASFQYLGANVIVDSSGESFLPSIFYKTFTHGVTVAFIGLTLEGTPAIVTPAGTAGLTFKDEATIINSLIPEIRSKGIKAIGVLIHEGAVQQGTATNINTCEGISGNVIDIVNQLDQEIDFVMSGHTHQAYNCVINGIPLTSAQHSGRVITQLDLEIDSISKDVIRASAKNIDVDNTALDKNDIIDDFLVAYEAIAVPIGNAVIGTLDISISKTPNEDGESLLGRLIADAQLFATANVGRGNAVITFTNPGGIRTSLRAGDVSYKELYAVQPFSNMMMTQTLMGKDIKAILEQQFSRDRVELLPVSIGFYYEWDNSLPVGHKVDTNSMKLNGTPMDMDADYRVSANEYLATGGSSYSAFTKGTDPVYSVPDNEAVKEYFLYTVDVLVPRDQRVKKVN